MASTDGAGVSEMFVLRLHLKDVSSLITNIIAQRDAATQKDYTYQ